MNLYLSMVKKCLFRKSYRRHHDFFERLGIHLPQTSLTNLLVFDVPTPRSRFFRQGLVIDILLISDDGVELTVCVIRVGYLSFCAFCLLLVVFSFSPLDYIVSSIFVRLDLLFPPLYFMFLNYSSI